MSVEVDFPTPPLGLATVITAIAALSRYAASLATHDGLALGIYLTITLLAKSLTSASHLICTANRHTCGRLLHANLYACACHAACNSASCAAQSFNMHHATFLPVPSDCAARYLAGNQFDKRF